MTRSPGKQNSRLSRLSKNRRGVAMLMVIVCIAVLVAVATEFAYNSRVNLQLAVNQRDEIRAYYLARSGVGLGRLLLQFQKQVDSMPLNLGGLQNLLGSGAAGGLQNLLGGGAAGGLQGLLGGGAAGGLQGLLGGAAAGGLPGVPGGASAGQSGGMNIQLWKLAKVDCHMLQGMVNETELSKRAGPTSRLSSDRDNPELAAKQGRLSFGTFDGCFDVKFTPEETKLNLNKLDGLPLSSRPLVARLMDIFSDKRFEFLFDHEDSNHVKITPSDLIIALKDWIDEDELQSTLNLTTQGDPFLKGFTDENYNYDRYNPRYKAKNAFFDTLDELYMVHGMNDRIMAAFRDRFTVYPDVNSLPNINTDDPILLYMAILSLADPARPDPRLLDPLFIDELIKRIRAAQILPFLGMSIQEFAAIVQMSGVAVNQMILSNPQNNRVIGDKNMTFTLKSVGEAGSVEKTITAVVRMDDAGLGRLLYWKEE